MSVRGRFGDRGIENRKVFCLGSTREEGSGVPVVSDTDQPDGWRPGNTGAGRAPCGQGVIRFGGPLQTGIDDRAAGFGKEPVDHAFRGIRMVRRNDPFVACDAIHAGPIEFAFQEGGENPCRR